MVDGDGAQQGEGMIELAPAGIEQALAGRTTVEEVYYKLSG